MSVRILRWEPVHEQGGRWVLAGLRLADGHLILQVESERPEQPVLELVWDSEVFFQARDEGDYLTLFQWGEFAFPHPFYIVEGSPVVARVVGESSGVRASDDLVHYAVYTTDTCVDVVALDPPTVRWVES